MKGSIFNTTTKFIFAGVFLEVLCFESQIFNRAIKGKSGKWTILICFFSSGVRSGKELSDGWEESDQFLTSWKSTSDQLLTSWKSSQAELSSLFVQQQGKYSASAFLISKPSCLIVSNWFSWNLTSALPSRSAEVLQSAGAVVLSPERSRAFKEFSLQVQDLKKKLFLFLGRTFCHLVPYRNPVLAYHQNITFPVLIPDEAGVKYPAYLIIWVLFKMSREKQYNPKD